MDNIYIYNTIFESIQDQYDEGILTFEQANELNELAYSKYICESYNQEDAEVFVKKYKEAFGALNASVKNMVHDAKLLDKNILRESANRAENDAKVLRTLLEQCPSHLTGKDVSKMHLYISSTATKLDDAITVGGTLVAGALVLKAVHKDLKEMQERLDRETIKLYKQGEDLYNDLMEVYGDDKKERKPNTSTTELSADASRGDFAKRIKNLEDDSKKHMQGRRQLGGVMQQRLFHNYNNFKVGRSIASIAGLAATIGVSAAFMNSKNEKITAQNSREFIKSQKNVIARYENLIRIAKNAVK